MFLKESFVHRYHVKIDAATDSYNYFSVLSEHKIPSQRFLINAQMKLSRSLYKKSKRDFR